MWTTFASRASPAPITSAQLQGTPQWFPDRQPSGGMHQIIGTPSLGLGLLVA